MTDYGCDPVNGDSYDWQAIGLCRGSTTPNMWFPTRGEPTREVKAICYECPVVIECGEYGIEHEKHGIWGGLSERERRQERKRRRLPEPGEFTPAEHGTTAKYRSGCRCAACRSANAAYALARRTAGLTERKTNA